MVGWVMYQNQEFLKDVSEAEVKEVIERATTQAEMMLPIRITTSAGLFEAW
jgi:hypothetical protein